MKESPEAIKNGRRSTLESVSNTHYRKRTKFTDSQLRILESNFHQSSYVSRERLLFLADNLGLTKKNIRIWYQNRRARQNKFNTSSVIKVNQAISQVFNEIEHKIPNGYSENNYRYYAADPSTKLQLSRVPSY
ncbi:MAG: hypothetical protein MHPSP_002992, partial [Paramarteilia canceri]